MHAPDRVDAVVIGASTRGLVAAYVLGTLGQRTVLLERSKHLSGVDTSFTTPGGARFDHGLHVLDSMRSSAATDLFNKVVEGRVHRTILERGIVLRGHLIPYDPEPAAMPSALRALLAEGDLVDDIGEDPPTRERLAACYGKGYADLVLDEVLPSYPSESRHLAFSVPEEQLLTNIYPWFFPRARGSVIGNDESRAFHDRLRRGVAQEVLYPEAGGFQGFADGFLRHLDALGVEIIFDAGDVHLDLEPGVHRVRGVEANGRRLQATNYFWAASWPLLCARLELPCQDAATDRFVLGSFVLNRPADSIYQEILVGDPRFAVNRISLPARFRGTDEPLLQVEFAYPDIADSVYGANDAASWRESWLHALRELGLLDRSHRVEEFDFRTFPIHMNGYGTEGEPLVDADPALLDPGSNLVPVVPSMSNLNLNTHVPRTIRLVTEVVMGLPPEPSDPAAQSPS